MPDDKILNVGISSIIQRMRSRHPPVVETEAGVQAASHSVARHTNAKTLADKDHCCVTSCCNGKFKKKKVLSDFQMVNA